MRPLQARAAADGQRYFLPGVHVLSGFLVGGRWPSSGVIVIFLGFGTSPPLGPVSWYGPGRCGLSPGFCGSGMRVTSKEFKLDLAPRILDD
jgi:hypothetical protein